MTRAASFFKHFALVSGRGVGRCVNSKLAAINLSVTTKPPTKARIRADLRGTKRSFLQQENGYGSKTKDPQEIQLP